MNHSLVLTMTDGLTTPLAQILPFLLGMHAGNAHFLLVLYEAGK